MSDEIPAWSELSALLDPVHEDVQLFARRIAGSNAEGDDVFQEAVLRAARKLAGLRERTKFKSWMCSIVVSVHRSRCRRAFWTRWISRDEARDAEPVGDDGSRWVDDHASALWVANEQTGTVSKLTEAAGEVFSLGKYVV